MVEDALARYAARKVRERREREAARDTKRIARMNCLREAHVGLDRGGALTDLYRDTSPRRTLAVTSLPINCSIVTPVFMYGGVETWIRDLVTSTDDDVIRWNEVCVTDRTMARGVTSEIERKNIRLSFGMDRAKHLADTQDVVVSWGMDAHGYWGKHSRSRLIVVAHGDGRSAFTRSIMSSCRDADMLVCCSPTSVACVPAGARSKVICNAVNEKRLEGLPVDLKGTLHIPTNAKILGFIGRLSWEKNPYDAINITAALGSGWHLVVVGHGDEMNDVVRHARTTASKAGIHFLGLRSDVGSILRGIDALVVTSSQEGFAYVIAEAWAVGTPVYSTPVGAAELWPHAVIYLPQGVRAGIQYSSGQVLSAARRRGPFHEAAQVITTTMGTDRQRLCVQEGRRVVETELSIKVFGEEWTNTIRELVVMENDKSKDHLEGMRARQM